MEAEQKCVKILESGDVVRYHAMPCIHNKQTNSQHQWRASMILPFIYNNPISYNMLMACLLHDFYEIFTGDLPSTIKWEQPKLKSLIDEIEKDFVLAYDMYVPSPEEKDAIKVADCMEMIVYMSENTSMVYSLKSRNVLIKHIESIIEQEKYKFKNIFNTQNIYKIIGEYCGK